MPQHFGDRLRDLRESAGLTQAQLAARAGVFRSTIVRLESGATLPTFATAQLIGQALGKGVCAFSGCRGKR